MKVLYYQYPSNLDELSNPTSDLEPTGDTTWHLGAGHINGVIINQQEIATPFCEKLEILSFPGAQFQFGGEGLLLNGTTYEVGPSGRFVLENVYVDSVKIISEPERKTGTKEKIDEEFRRIRDAKLARFEDDKKWLNETDDMFFIGIAYSSGRNEE